MSHFLEHLSQKTPGVTSAVRPASHTRLLSSNGTVMTGGSRARLDLISRRPTWIQTAIYIRHAAVLCSVSVAISMDILWNVGLHVPRTTSYCIGEKPHLCLTSLVSVSPTFAAVFCIHNHSGASSFACTCRKTRVVNVYVHV